MNQTIYHWEVVQHNQQVIIQGFLSLDPKTTDYKCGTIRTSYIELLNIKGGWVKTKNSFYYLGVPKKEDEPTGPQTTSANAVYL